MCIHACSDVSFTQLNLEAADLCCLSEGQNADECEAGDGGGSMMGGERKEVER